MTVTTKRDFLLIDYKIEIPMTKLAIMMNRYKSIHHIASMTSKDEEKFNDELDDFLQNNIAIKANNDEINTRWNPDYARWHGIGDLGFFEYHIHLIADVDPSKSPNIKIENRNFPIQRAVFNDRIINTQYAHAENAHLPENMGWQRNEKYRTIKFEYKLGASTIGETGISQYGIHKTNTANALLKYLKVTKPTAKIMLIACLMSILLGAIHALSPGHGKTLVAAYLVGQRGTVKHALALGGIVTFTHIISVVILGVIGLALAEYMLPEYYSPFISLASGIIIIAIGIWSFIKLFRHRNKNHHHHTHHHEYSDKTTWKQIIMLGISGGMVPCPAAMAVMLTAIAIGRILLGLTLIAFFSIGLAAVLIAIGVLTVKASALFERVSAWNRISSYVPMISATIVTALGAIIAYYGFWIPWTTM